MESTSHGFRAAAAAVVLFVVPGLALTQPVVPVEVASVVSGGTWERGAESGSFRVVIVNRGWEHVSSRLYIEWVLLSESREQKVIAQLEPQLPVGQLAHVLSAKILPRKSGRTEVLVSAESNMEVGSKPKHLLLRLGEPGRVEVVQSGAR